VAASARRYRWNVTREAPPSLDDDPSNREGHGDDDAPNDASEEVSSNAVTRAWTATDGEAAPTIALRGADTHRAVRGYAGAAMVCLVGVAGLQVVHGQTVLYLVTTSLATLTGLYTGWLGASRWRGGLFNDREATTALVLMCTTALSAVAFAGPLSAPAVMLVILVAALAMGNESRGRVVFVLATVGYALLIGLSVAGAIPAVINAVAIEDPLIKITVGIVVEIVLVVSYWFGVSARRSTQQALESVQRARVALMGRDALLQEARADLDRVAKGAKAGRLTGEVLGEYRLADVLGRGAMGEVYEASNGEDVVALKVLHPNLVSDTHVVRRFFREAQICSDLSSPNVVRVLGFGEAEDGSPYLAMERVQGRTLAALLRNRGLLALEQVAEMVEQVSSGLEAAHDVGVVHRDVKPSNLICIAGPPRLWKVLDFGISKLHGSGTLTGDGLVGTPGYMSPEQAHGSEVDRRADVFALGAVAYRAVTGVPPFAGLDPMAILLKATQRQPPAPRSIVDLPEDVELVLALALAKDRRDRIDSAATFAEAFSAAVEGRLDHALRRRGQRYLERMPWTDALLVAARDDGPEGGTLGL
jgi:eukaryotic-like serine/threonine-protein kinase